MMVYHMVLCSSGNHTGNSNLKGGSNYRGKSAFIIIEECRGSQFDPQVVDVFLAVKDEILSIREKYKD